MWESREFKFVESLERCSYESNNLLFLLPGGNGADKRMLVKGPNPVPSARHWALSLQHAEDTCQPQSASSANRHVHKRKYHVKDYDHTFKDAKFGNKPGIISEDTASCRRRASVDLNAYARMLQVHEHTEAYTYRVICLDLTHMTPVPGAEPSRGEKGTEAKSYSGSRATNAVRCSSSRTTCEGDAARGA